MGKRETNLVLSDEEVIKHADIFMLQTGSRVRAIRTELGVMLKSLVDYGLPMSVQSRIETGKVNFTTRTATLTAYALGVRAWEFFHFDGEDIPRPKRRPSSAPSAEWLAKATQEFQDQIGNRIRALRTFQGMSVNTLMAYSGVDLTTLLNLEKGRYSLRATTAVRLADGIGVRPHELFLPREQSGIQAKVPKATKKKNSGS